MAYIPAKDVHSPRASWSLVRVLFDQGASTLTQGALSMAIGTWSSSPRLALRWNGTNDAPAGNPQSRGFATWFILPPEAEEDNLRWARSLMSAKDFEFAREFLSGPDGKALAA